MQKENKEEKEKRGHGRCYATILNPLKPKKKRENIWGKARGALYLRGKNSILLEGTQEMPARPSDKGRMGVKTLGWWVVKA
jgi:hypothetical protein